MRYKLKASFHSYNKSSNEEFDLFEMIPIFNVKTSLVESDSYVLCFLEQMHKATKKRVLYNNIDPG